MTDSPYGDVRLSRTRSLRGQLAFSQELPPRALARKLLLVKLLYGCRNMWRFNPGWQKFIGAKGATNL